MPATVEDSYIQDTLTSPMYQMEEALIAKSRTVITEWREVRERARVIIFLCNLRLIIMLIIGR